MQAENGRHIVQDTFSQNMVSPGVTFFSWLEDELHSALQKVKPQKDNQVTEQSLFE